MIKTACDTCKVEFQDSWETERNGDLIESTFKWKKKSCDISFEFSVDSTDDLCPKCLDELKDAALLHLASDKFSMACKQAVKK